MDPQSRPADADAPASQGTSRALLSERAAALGLHPGAVQVARLLDERAAGQGGWPVAFAATRIGAALGVTERSAQRRTRVLREAGVVRARRMRSAADPSRTPNHFAPAAGAGHPGWAA